MTLPQPPNGKQIEVFSPTIGPEEQAAVRDVLASGWLGLGPKVAEFESAWAAHIGVPVEHVVAVSCATEGLEQVIKLLEWGEIAVPGNCYIGTTNVIPNDDYSSYRFYDIDRHTLNPTLDIYRDVIDVKPSKTRGAVLQHFGGVACEYEEIVRYLDGYDIVVIEDRACMPLPPNDYEILGEYAVWSFDAMKIITCGDGGMVYCRSADDAEQIRRATRLGVDTFSAQGSTAHDRWWEFTVSTPGRRAVMNDIGAAIGLAQLKKLPQLVQLRQWWWNEYQRQLAGLDWLTLPPEPPSGTRSSYYCYWVQCEQRDALARWLRDRGIYTTYRYHAPHLAYGWSGIHLPGVEWAQARTLLLPLHANLTVEQVDYICEQVRAFGRTL